MKVIYKFLFFIGWLLVFLIPILFHFFKCLLLFRTCNSIILIYVFLLSEVENKIDSPRMFKILFVCLTVEFIFSITEYVWLI